MEDSLVINCPGLLNDHPSSFSIVFYLDLSGIITGFRGHRSYDNGMEIFIHFIGGDHKRKKLIMLSYLGQSGDIQLVQGAFDL